MHNLRRCFAVALLVISGSSMHAQYDGTAAAKQAFQDGEKASESGRYTAAIADYKKAISLDPNFMEAHQRYLQARIMEPAGPELDLMSSGKKLSPKQQEDLTAAQNKAADDVILEYKSLIKQYPDKAIYPWALGQVYNEKNPLTEEEYCQQSIHIDSHFSPGYQCLAAIASLRGDDKAAIDYERKVMELDPNNADAIANYVYFLRNDPAAFKPAVMDYIRKFPDSSNSAQMLYSYGAKLKDDASKIEIFEQLRKQFPPDKFTGSQQGVSALFGIYDRSDPPKAQALAHELLGVDPKDNALLADVAYADSMAKAEQKVKDHKPADALAILQTVKSPFPRQFSMDRKDLLEARALDLENRKQDAYSSLLAIYVKHPTDEIRTAVDEYGAKLGKKKQEVEAAIWSAIEMNSTPEIPFTLKKFTDGSEVSLADYKGRVVIVDFWFPNCGPCRESFPFLQQLASKYKEKGVDVLAINATEGQEAFVLPFLKSTGYSFIPLRSNFEWAHTVYSINSFPTTFFIGGDKRVYFKTFVSDQDQERTAELELDLLLAHRGQ
jgi:thiol-disulfide isomerase/thioredoxin